MTEISFIQEKYRHQLDSLVTHPLQSWAWGEFRKKTGVDIIRLGRSDDHALQEVVTITFHTIPHTLWKIGYVPKSLWPSEELMKTMYEEAKKRKCIFVKLEPNIEKIPNLKSQIPNLSIVPSNHPLFTKFTQFIQLDKSEEELLKSFHPKTRYNIKVAQKHGITIREHSDEEAFNEYLKLTFETTKRQGFFAHTKDYHQKMWDTLKKEHIAHLLTAEYTHDGTVHTLVAWIVFLFNGVLYYPYGASSDEFRNVMASTLMMWEAIKFGKKHGAKIFDLWGSLGPDADPRDSWHGFHRFKQGFGAEIVEFAGSYDLVINPILYQLYNVTFNMRAEFLKLKRKLT